MRKIIKIIASILTLILTVGCGIAPTPREDGLVFEDDFNGTKLNSKKWERCPEWDRQGKSKWVDELSYLDGEGNLILRMEWNREDLIVNCGAVRTKGLFEYGFGYYEARIKFTPHYGAWGAFWMMVGDVESEENGSKDGVEIDIIETIENQNGKYNHALHWDGYGDNHKSYSPKLLKKVNIYDGEYHTFGLLRNEKGYTFYIDGEVSSFVSAEDCEPCEKDGYLKLTCESAEWAGGGSIDCILGLPAEMIVDYVRVYDRLPDYIK